MQKQMAAQVPPEPELWCMLWVRPGKEQDARDNFRNHGIRCYWPCFVPFIVRHGDRNRRPRNDPRAIIPGYLFVPLPATTKFWQVVELQSGIVTVVRSFAGELVHLRDKDIEVIRAIDSAMNTPTPGKSPHQFKTGDRVRFKDDVGSLLPHGHIAHSTGDGRVSVEVDVMGRLVPFVVYPHQIERIS
jgi:transcription antitermination factor NusG